MTTITITLESSDEPGEVYNRVVVTRVESDNITDTGAGLLHAAVDALRGFGYHPKNIHDFLTDWGLGGSEVDWGPG